LGQLIQQVLPLIRVLRHIAGINLIPMDVVALLMNDDSNVVMVHVLVAAIVHGFYFSSLLCWAAGVTMEFF
jgi:hypothetical protein